MGWFSRSSTTTASEAIQQEDHSVKADQHTTDASNSQQQQQQPQQPESSTSNVNSQENSQPQSDPETQSPTTTPTTQHHGYNGELPEALHFKEYEDADDIYARFKVGDAMNHLAACSSLGSNIRNYYRFGTFRDCTDKYDHLKFCLSLKTKSTQVAQVMIQKHDAEMKVKKAGQPNSEDVWTKRTHPPEDLVSLSRQG
ncbi:hypothetical protein EMPS_08323 [Entomortierella parvispora]|uniref:Uncharacterized protein n=1 Tax=Entomortierella parvispora TaxID=205924 RepID=A0A9P3HG69_9FUNG|nr:hypothetical protein EMPS_08323 [Entomortierella parvispora]